MASALTAGTDPNNFNPAKTGSGPPKWTVKNNGTSPGQPNQLKQSGVVTSTCASR